jgi:DNA-binding NarL/FixJ family response regulator
LTPRYRIPTAGKTLAIEDLTDREMQIIKLIAQGLNHKEVAAQIGLSWRSVSQRVHELGRRVDQGGSTPMRRLTWWWFNHVAEDRRSTPRM